MNDRIRSLTEAIDQKVYSIEKVTSKLEGVLRECDLLRQAI